MAVLQKLGNEGDVGGEVVVEVGFVGEGEFGGLCGGSGLADQAEGDLIDGVGIIAGFGGPGYKIIAQFLEDRCFCGSFFHCPLFMKTLTNHQSLQNIAVLWMWRFL